MDLIELIILLIIAGVCGALAEMIVGFSTGGFLASIVVGLIGAYLGSWLAPLLGLPPVLSTAAIAPNTTAPDILPFAFDFDIVWSILGAVLLLLIVSLVRRPRRRVRYR